MRDPNINLDWTAATLSMERELYLSRGTSRGKDPEAEGDKSGEKWIVGEEQAWAAGVTEAGDTVGAKLCH